MLIPFLYLRRQQLSIAYVLQSMKNSAFFFLFLFFIAGCRSGENAPDISGIQVSLRTERFDQDFFSIDTNRLSAELQKLQVKYPQLLPVYLQSVLGVSDEQGIRNYLRLYGPVYDSAQKIYKDFGSVSEDIEKGLRYVKYYFPQYQLPAKLVPVVGPMNSMNDLAKMGNGELTPNFIGPDFVGISLQFYLGRDFSLYNEEYFINNVVPRYRSRRFSREYIVADVMKLVADDIFPDRSQTKPLVEQMIERGKQWWLIDKFLPGIPDTIKTGYTGQQLAWCRENEGLIWSYIVKNENLYDLSPATIQLYIGEAPFTQGFSQEDSPGNLGPWIGWQILRKFVDKNPDMSITEVMKTSPRQILEKTGYKPK